jgi:hypothetical protein
MIDLMTAVTGSPAFQILAFVSGVVAALYEAYVRLVTKRATRGPVLDAELALFFDKLQLKWRAPRARR